MVYFILWILMLLLYQCPIQGCTKKCKSARGLTQHVNSFHRQPPLASSQLEANKQCWMHPYLTGETIIPSDNATNNDMPSGSL